METASPGGFRYLKFADYEVLANWSAAFANQSAVLYNKAYELSRIGQLLLRNKTRVLIEDEVSYQRVKIKLYGKGLIQRDIASGKSIKTKNQFRICEGQFLMSKIDARNGAFGIVPTELDGATVTQDFLSYDINASKINPTFFLLLTATPRFLEICERASSGTTGRRRVDENLFLNFQVPLPSLEVQNALVGAYTEKLLAAQAQQDETSDSKGRLQQLLGALVGVQVKGKASIDPGKSRIQFVEYTDLDRWSLNFLLRGASFSFAQSQYPVTKVGRVMLRMAGGKTPATTRADFWDGDINWTSPKDFSGIVLGEAQDKITDSAVEEAGLQVFPAGSILAVFRSGILRHSFPVAITTEPTAINQDLKAMVVDATKVLPKYFLYYLHCFQTMVIEQASKKSVTVESINVDEFLELPFVLPPLNAQEEIVAAIEAQLAADAAAKLQAKELRAAAIQQFEQAIFH